MTQGSIQAEGKTSDWGEKLSEIQDSSSEEVRESPQMKLLIIL